MQGKLARLEDENRALREANVALHTQINEAHAALNRFQSVVANANLSVVGELCMFLPPAPGTLAYLLNALSAHLRSWY